MLLRNQPREGRGETCPSVVSYFVNRRYRARWSPCMGALLLSELKRSGGESAPIVSSRYSTSEAVVHPTHSMIVAYYGSSYLTTDKDIHPGGHHRPSLQETSILRLRNNLKDMLYELILLCSAGVETRIVEPSLMRSLGAQEHIYAL